MRKSTVKKTEAKAPVVKEEAVQAESTVSMKAETAEPEKKEEKPAAAKKSAAAKKPAAAKKTPAEKKTSAGRTAKPAEAAVEMELQFAGKEYTAEKLVAIAKDVWQYDLGGKPEAFKTVKLYVKPEESAVYYVINGETTGSFAI